MIVLGINHSNDAAAAIVRDGVVIAASREERFSRVKHDSSFPHRAIDFCLKAGDVALEDLDGVAFFWNPGIHATTPNSRMSGSFRHHLEFLHTVPNNLLPRIPGVDVGHVEQIFHLTSGKQLRVHYVTHHLCHAASVLFRSPFEDSALLTVDGYGERASTHVAQGAGLDIETLHTVEFPHSLGSVYAAFTQYLGFRANNGEGKVMGLASYGGTVFDEVIGEMIRPTETGFTVDLDFFGYQSPHGPRYSQRLVELLGPPRLPDSPVEQHHMDIAHGLQKATEETLLHLARLTREKTGSPRLGMAGGVVLNCVANGRIAREAGFEECFFQPAADDAGTSMGAALWVSHCLNRAPRAKEVTATDYLGPAYGETTIEEALQRAGVAYERCEDAPAEAARMLADGHIIGWFQGAAEFGPRALGNRSILANPALEAVKDTLNARVKFREPFRPFAPSCLEESCGELFDSDVPSPYMLRVYNTLEARSADLEGVTHVDGGARVQTVNKTQNPRYHALIEAFNDLTGIPCVLNTSFNIRGEPIVHTVADALKCTLTTGMDAVFIGDFKVVKGE